MDANTPRKDNPNVGRCKRCRFSVLRLVADRDVYHRWCQQYQSWCQPVARNCDAPPCGW